MLVRLLAVMVLCLPWPTPAQSPSPFTEAELEAASRLRERALKGTGAFNIVASLTSEVGARLAGSEGDRAAVAWALRQLRELGFENIRAQSVTVPRWVRGSIELAILEPWPQPLVAEALGGSVGTEETGITADVVHVANLEALKKLECNQVENRIVFINQRTRRSRDLSGYMAAVPTRTEGASAAAALGAAAVVIRSIGTDNNRTPHTGAVRYAEEHPRIPAVALSNPDADMLEHQLATGRPVTLRLKLTSRELEPTRSANVIGEIPGSDPAGQIVLLGAHLDSWDLGTGALDDGAGVAIVMEAARLIAEMSLNPRRTLRVVLFANEEFGLSGATAYARLDAAERDRHMVAMEADLGAGAVWRIDTGVANSTLPRVEALTRALQPLGIELGANDTEGGADIRPLHRLGIPVLRLVHDGSKYLDFHHTANDTLDKIDPKVLDRSVAAYAVAAYLTAVMNGDFGRVPTAK